MWVKRRLMKVTSSGSKQWWVFDDAAGNYWGAVLSEGGTLPLTEDDERKLALLMMLDTRGAAIEGVGASFMPGAFIMYEEDNHS